MEGNPWESIELERRNVSELLAFWVHTWKDRHWHINNLLINVGKEYKLESTYVKILSLIYYIFYLALCQILYTSYETKTPGRLNSMFMHQAQDRAFSTVAPHLNVILDLPGAPWPSPKLWTVKDE